MSPSINELTSELSIFKIYTKIESNSRYVIKSSWRSTLGYKLLHENKKDWGKRQIV